MVGLFSLEISHMISERFFYGGTNMLTINQKLIIDQKVLIEHVNFTIDEGEHIAVIGDNGVGKSVLMNMLAEQFHVEILSQSIDSEETVMDYIFSSQPELYQLKQQKNYDYNAMNSYIEAQGFEMENEVVMRMKRFNIREEAAEQPVNILSGGEQTKIGLIKLLMSSPDILLFDEPTNHMDSETKNWLKNWMNHAGETIVFVSHDRDFINNTATKIVELTKHGAKTYHLNYEAYVLEKEREKRENAALLDKEKKEKAKMKQMIQEMKEWHHEAAGKASVRDPGAQKKVAKIANRYKVKEHQLNQKMEKFQGKTQKEERSDLSIQAVTFEAKQYARFEHVDFSYQQRVLLSDVSFTIDKGDKIAVEGRNGSGKSTLLKLLIGEHMPSRGQISVNPHTVIGYFSQQLENLNKQNTVLDEILEIDQIDVSTARTILASFRFKAARIDDRVGDLSMGEQCRLAFVKLYFSNANLLVLDEPTNYFDISMQQVIENLLKNYDGAIIFVSHDRYFSQQVSNRRFKIEDGRLIDMNKVVDKEINTDQLIDELKELVIYEEK